MKVLKINKKDYVLKFTTKALMNLNAKGITLTSLASDMEKLNLISLYEAFHEGLKFANKDITLDQAYELIDLYYDNEVSVIPFAFRFIKALVVNFKTISFLLIFSTFIY